MNKRALLIVSASSVLAFALSIVVIVVASAARLNLSSGIFMAILALFGLGLISGAVAWMLGLMQTARCRQWEWFVEILALGPVGALIFAGFGQQGAVDLLAPVDA
jgi:hypothetical protein